ncbi:MAG TPA: acyclic terpene utilization AtuA family protein [Acetobacteraceae bacterium]|nr:acyclic terpene utilization AtuA family protein [Acetobacteraceae bacterium]
MRTVRIGSGAGFSGDRVEPAVELAEQGDIGYLGFECLAERTIALAQQARLADPAGGFDPLLVTRMEAVLPACVRRGIRIVTNMGAANPLGAASETARVARRLGLAGLIVAAVTGDDVLADMQAGDHPLLERPGEAVATLRGRMVSANAYLGVGPIVQALSAGADVVITGRVADPALFMAPLVHEFGWRMDDWERLGQGTVIGHLLECAGQITGGYFADPGYKTAPDLARLGFPLAEVRADGSAVITKVAGSGGAVSLASCKEQLLYELHDPARYYQPDVVADFSAVRLEAAGPDRVTISGGSGAPRTGRLKVSIGYLDSHVGEGQLSYAGAGALARARLALEIVRERLALTGVRTSELRCEIIGVDALHRGPRPDGGEPSEVRLRVVGRTDSMSEALRIGNEVETLYTNGPAGGGGAWKSARQVVGVVSTLIDAARVRPTVSYEVA